MSNRKSEAPSRELSRRETIQLATAVGALGVGLGVTFDAAGAPAPIRPRLTADKAGTLSIKLYRQVGEDGAAELVQVLDLSRLVDAVKAKGGIVSDKWYSGNELVAQHDVLEVVRARAKG